MGRSLKQRNSESRISALKMVKLVVFAVFLVLNAATAAKGRIETPDAPKLRNVSCLHDTAVVKWQVKSSHGGPILNFIIQVNTGFTLDGWIDATDKIPPEARQFEVPMTPWANYSFQVIAVNKIGRSWPSEPSSPCSTAPDVPYQNPDRIQGGGDKPDNLIIRWRSMPPFEHNGLGFFYRVFWKRKDIDIKWSQKDISNWAQAHHYVYNTPTFVPYVVKVEAHNSLGPANVTAEEVTVYSGEDVPLKAPEKINLVKVYGPRTAEVSWTPVPPETLRGGFRGYKVQTWTEREGTAGLRDMVVPPNRTQAVVNLFVPYVDNYVRVLAFNDRYDGPPCKYSTFRAPEGTPGPVRHLNGVPLNSTAVKLSWTDPLEHNGVIISYQVDYTEDGNADFAENYTLTDPRVTEVILTGLKPNTVYLVAVVANTFTGSGVKEGIEATTMQATSPPDKLYFTVECFFNKHGTVDVRTTLELLTKVHFGESYYVEYKKAADTEFIRSNKKSRINDGHNVVTGGLQLGTVYQFQLVSLSGKFETISNVIEITTPQNYTDPAISRVVDYNLLSLNQLVAKGETAVFNCEALRQLRGNSEAQKNVTVNWLFDEKPIDFENEQRIYKGPISQLVITGTSFSDSGIYTCDVRSQSTSASLIVQDVPNAPKLLGVNCSEEVATVQWESMGDNESPITSFKIQANSYRTPYIWSNVNLAPATFSSFEVSMKEWDSHRFRVKAVNRIGDSLPSEPSEPCLIEPGVPANNPYNVQADGVAPDNLVITWMKMDPIEHNGPGFFYRVLWKRKDIVADWEMKDINDWQQTRLVLKSTDKFVPYVVKIEAHNHMGKAEPDAAELNCYSAEHVPTKAPTNFQLIRIVDNFTAEFSWDPVPKETLNGNFLGYKLEIWQDSEDSVYRLQHEVGPHEKKAEVQKFLPYTENFVRVSAFNGKFSGPPSETISFVTLEGKPGHVNMLRGVPINSTSLRVLWEEPYKKSGILTAYYIRYKKDTDKEFGNTYLREHPKQTEMTIVDLEPNTVYNVSIRAATSKGVGVESYIASLTKDPSTSPPDKPSFTLANEEVGEGARVELTVDLPANASLANYYIIHYKRRDDPTFNVSQELLSDSVSIKGLDYGTVYQFQVTGVNEIGRADSDIMDITTPGIHPQVISNLFNDYVSKLNSLMLSTLTNR